MSPITSVVEYEPVRGEKFPQSIKVYELDGEALAVEEKILIHEALGGGKGKYIVYGEHTEATEAHNRAFLMFFRDSRDYSHRSVWESIQKASPEYEIKAAGMADLSPENESLKGDSITLSLDIDTHKQMKWRYHMNETLGIEVQWRPGM